jgi:hypothetical protein
MAIPVEDALDLACLAENFSLIREASSPADYARLELEKCLIPLKEELFKCANLYQYGEKLMEHQCVSYTGYGALVSHNGQTVKQ